jgi:hypothetical protein
MSKRTGSTVNFGLTVQASTGATRKQLLRVVGNVLLGTN